MADGGASPGGVRSDDGNDPEDGGLFSVVVVGGGERLLAQGRPALGVGLARHPREVALARGLLGGARAEVVLEAEAARARRPREAVFTAK